MINSRGFTLVETLVGVFIFSLIALAVYQGLLTSFKLATIGKIKTEATLLANEQFELVRNLPYQSVGISAGIPSGVLPRTQTFVRSGVTFVATTTVRNIDDPFDGTIGGSPSDSASADYKQVALTISCRNCPLSVPLVFTTTAAPKNVENSSGNGALFINVIDADGAPVPQASVHVENNKVTPKIVIDETTTNTGQLQLVDVPPGSIAYEVKVTKSGYSTDQTYSTTTANPNPTQPHLTVATQQVTAKTFFIDRVGNLDINSLTNVCAAVPSLPFTMTGKIIGTNPTVYKYSQNLTTDSSGNKVVNGLEWDDYDFQVTSASYDLIGTTPFLPISLQPGATQAVSLVVGPKLPKALLVNVKDVVTGLPISGASVTLKKGSSTIGAKTTDRGALSQTDWSGGPGQADFVNQTMYTDDNGGVDYSSSVGDLKLKKVGSNYVAAGTATSSVFDIGSATESVFYNISWTQNLPSSTNIQFQIATANTNTATTTWTFRGPDGGASTYYTASNGNIHSSNSGNRYLRYQAYLTSASASKTPTLSDVSITYGNSCLPFGQVLFNSLVSATNYKITVTASGYQTYTSGSLTVSPDWQKVDAPLQPN